MSVRASNIWSGLPDFQGRLPAGLRADFHQFATLIKHFWNRASLVLTICHIQRWYPSLPRERGAHQINNLKLHFFCPRLYIEMMLCIMMQQDASFLYLFADLKLGKNDYNIIIGRKKISFWNYEKLPKAWKGNFPMKFYRNSNTEFEPKLKLIWD